MDQPTNDTNPLDQSWRARPTPVLPEPDVVQQLRQALDGLMTVEDITVLSNETNPPVQFRGRLSDNDDQEAVFDRILQRFEKLGYTPILSAHEDRHVLHAIHRVFDQKPKKLWVNALLFVATVISVMFIGMARESDGAIPTTLKDWLVGVPFALAMLGILTAHELSH